MKKVILTTLAVVSTFVMANAQRAFEFGVKGGVNLSQIRGDGSGSRGTANMWTTANRATGFTGGIYTKFGNRFYVQPELMLSQKGGTFTNAAGTEVNLRQTYIDVPVLLGTTIGTAVRLNAGPVASVVLNKDKNFLQNLGINDQEQLNSANLGFQVGAGFNISKLRLDMRYEGNINDVVNITSNTQLANQTKGKGNLYLVTLGYAF